MSKLSTMVGAFIKRSITSASKIRTIAPVHEAALSEQCIVVNENDKVIGSASKRDCHTVQENGTVLLHRAFSVFLFNTNGEMLLQKRAASKITFPSHVTNACCSHPLHDFSEEMEEKNASGIKSAAMRRLHFELGIPRNQMKVNDFTYLTRIQYQDLGDKVWGEHEIDYVLFFQKNVTLNLNPDEVSEVFYVSKNNFDSYLNSHSDPITPWFRLIAKNHLHEWWNNLSSLQKFQDHVNIKRY